MKSLVEALTLVIPFLEAYPAWVKLLAGGWIALTAVLVISLLFARPPSAPDAAVKNGAEMKASAKLTEPPPLALMTTPPTGRGAPAPSTSSSVVVDGSVAGSVIISQGQVGGQIAHQITNVGPQPRRLAAEAIDALIRDLSGLPRQRYEIEAVHGDTEARNLAFQLNEALQRSGWSNTAFVSSMFPQPITGLEVSASPAATREVEVIVSLLSRAGLSPRFKILPDLTQVHILVGTQP